MVRVARRPAAVWARRGIVASVLLAVIVIPGRAVIVSVPHCASVRCVAPGSILWAKPLAGSWVAENGVAGTVPASGEAYVGAAGGLAVIGNGLVLSAYQAQTGMSVWRTALTGFPAGAAIVSVRVWPGVVAAGVAVPGASAGQRWSTAIVTASAGNQVATFPAAQAGGAVWAAAGRVVIVGKSAVTSYVIGSGRVRWRRSTGGAAQAWAVSGRYLYVARTAGGYLSSSPVTLLARIDLRTGGVRDIRPPGRAFSGTLTAVVGGVALFSAPGGLSGYSAQSGRLLWRQPAGVLELTDPASEAIYVGTGTTLALVGLTSGAPEGARVSNTLAESLYAVRDGVALGLDQGALGEAWGYSLAGGRVVWTSPALPWPHFYVDLTGLGGSVRAGAGVALLTTCAASGATGPSNGAAPCRKPELVALEY